MLQYSQAVSFSEQLVSRFSAKEINRARAEEAFGEEEEAAEDFTETTEKAEDAE